MTHKILIVTDNIPNQINGVVTTYKNIEKYAKQDGYEIYYIDPSMYPYIDCPFYPEIKLAYPINFKKSLETIDPDYIHIATEGPIGLYARVYLSLHGYKFTTAYHTKFPEALKSILGIPEFLSWYFIRWFHKKSSKVLTTTNTMVADLLANGFSSNVISWTRGVDRAIFTPAINRSANTKTILLCVSRVSKEKNLEQFLSIEYPNSIKILVGDGPKLEEYKNLYPDVIFTGVKLGKELAYYYQIADVFVFPSKWDTFGIVMIEALACGTPVAAYNVPGPADVVDNEITGYLSNNLITSIDKCLSIDREVVERYSYKWSWYSAWIIFKNNLVNKVS
jgi:glycosyltransferase involved in cell wall biosynthesis